MASALTNRYKLEMAEADVDIAAAAKSKLMLLNSTYAPNVDTHDLVDNGGAGDPIDHEIAVSGYVGGYGGAGRKVPTTRVWNRDDANDRAEYDHDDVAWIAVAAGATIGGVGHIVEDFLGTAGDDTESLFAAFDDTNDVASNGGDLTYAPNAEGVIQV